MDEPSNAANDARLNRYSRQVLYENIGIEGQRRLGESRVLLVGCGALGTVLANTLVRAGVGHLRICDRDFVELDNLQRQVLFDENDIAEQLPKAEAAARKLTRINSAVTVEPIITDVNATNIEQLAEGAQLLLDGTDNFETRFLINDLAVKTRRPWIYGAVIGATGLCMPVLPDETPCLRCVFAQAPPAEFNPTCDTAGVLGSAVNVVASLQAVEAIKILTGRLESVSRRLMSIDLWAGRFINLNVQSLNAQSTGENADCPCCRHGRFDYLDGQRGSTSISLCGRNAVQVYPTTTDSQVDLHGLAQKLRPIADGINGKVSHNQFLLRFNAESYELTVFPDGRAIIKGTDDIGKAKAIYAKYIGA